MPENQIFLPEGMQDPAIRTLAELREAAERGTILEGTAVRCDAERNLHVALGGSLTGIMTREEAVSPYISGSGREIALLSRVGRPVCFQVLEVGADEKGAPRIRLSRRRAQERALDWFLKTLRPGTIVTGRVTHLEPFGAFVDIGCGVIAMLGAERMAISRVSHPSERFRPGKKLLAAVLSVDPERRRFTLTHRELLGTWMENASLFQAGEAVPGIVRSVRDYGCFVELTPNLAGLAERKEGVAEGDRVSVYLKSIRPERMKIKLQIIEKLPPDDALPPLRYTITDGQLTAWVYSPPNYEGAPVQTVFAPAEEPFSASPGAKISVK